jgi:hypothetical protein
VSTWVEVRSRRRDLLVILSIGWLVRALVIRVLPVGAHSLDFDAFALVASIVGTGENPYATTTKLNWPPLLMQLVWAIRMVSEPLGVAFIDALRAFLVGVESLVAAATVWLVRTVAPRSDWRPLVLWGIALNPVSILMVCQHGTMDHLAVLWMVLACIFLVRHDRHADPVDWLMACMFVGLGGLTKTYPLILSALLVSGFRRVDWRFRTAGLMLLGWASAVGLSALYVIDPESVSRNVLGYEAIPGYFGVTGLANLFGWITLWNSWSLVSKAGMLCVVGWIAWRQWEKKGPLGDRQLVLVVMLLLLGIPTLGPGFGTQYAVWSLPFAIATWPLFDRRWRILLLVGLVVTSVSYLVIYGLAHTHGMALARAIPDGTPSKWIDFVSSRRGQTLLLLPMFMVWLAVLVRGIGLLRESRVASPSPVD